MACLGCSPTKNCLSPAIKKNPKLPSQLLYFHTQVHTGCICPPADHGPTAPPRPDSVRQCLVVMLTLSRSKTASRSLNVLLGNKCKLSPVPRSVGKLGHYYVTFFMNRCVRGVTHDSKWFVGAGVSVDGHCQQIVRPRLMLQVLQKKPSVCAII